MVGDDLADDGGVPAERMRAHLGEDGIGHLGADDGEQLAFVGDVERVEAEDLAGAADRFAHGDGRARCSSMPTLARLAISLSVVAAPPRVGSRRQWMKSGPLADGVASMAATRPFSEAQSLSIAPSNSRPSRCDMMAMPWSPMVAAEEDGVAGSGAVGGDVDAVGDDADAGGVDEDLVALAAVDDLGVAGDELDAGFGGGRRAWIRRCGGGRRRAGLLRG